MEIGDWRTPRARDNRYLRHRVGNAHPEILDRNPPELTTLAGLDNLFAKNRPTGSDFKCLAWAHSIFRS
jgi:hypothetical protein